MELYKLSTGDSVHRYDKSIVVVFNGKRRVLSTSIYNGGLSDEYTYVFNHDSNPGAGVPYVMTMDTYEEHMAQLAKDMGFDPHRGTGMGTAASMENVAIVSETYQMLTITAIVTGGIEVNGGRVGDPASHFKPLAKGDEIPLGTINIILCIDGEMSGGILSRALVTCTEAKTAALQELMADSKYSTGLATGSGTDQTIVVSNLDSPWQYDSAGKHSKVGELIGRVVKEAVKRALHKQTNLNPQTQYDALKRICRYGITVDSLYQAYLNQGGTDSKHMFVDRVERWAIQPDNVIKTSLAIHLMDQWQWGLLTDDDVVGGLHWLYHPEKQRISATDGTAFLTSQTRSLLDGSSKLYTLAKLLEAEIVSKVQGIISISKVQ